MPRRSIGVHLRTSVLPLMALGAVSGLGQAPFGWWICTLIGLVFGLWLTLLSQSAKQAMLRGWSFATGYFGLSLMWLVEPFMVDAARHAWMAPFAVFFMSGGLALLWGGAAGVAHRFSAANWRWLLLAISLTAAELIRARLFTGFPWASPGHVWIDTALAQLASVIGASGLGALTFLVAATIAQGIVIGRGAGAGTHALTGGGLMGILLAPVILLGPAQPMPPDQETTLRLIQPNAPQHLKWHPKYGYDFVTRQIELTASPPAPDQPKPDLVIWPETAVPTLLEWTGGLLEQMAEAAGGAPILFGIQRGEGVRYFNSLALLGADASILATYDKHHLVPFGEYIPFGDRLAKIGINAFAAQSGNGYSAGPGARVLDLGPTGKMLPLICYEAVFPRDIRAAPERADWILHATNDAWFGDFSMPFQHLDQARFRAIEFGLPVIRVANTGVSAVIDTGGTVRAQIPLNTSGFLDAKIPASLPATPYSRHGDQPLTFLVLTVLGAFVIRRHTKSI